MRALLTLALVCGGAAGAQEIYDLLLKGGHVIDIANKRNERLDIGIVGGKVKAIAKSIPVSHGRRVVDVSDYYVTPGLVDIHAHLDLSAGPNNVNADHNSLRSGVTTVVDGGSAGWRNFERFKKKVVEESKTRVLAFVNISADGMSLGGEETADAAAAAKAVAKYPELIVGIYSAIGSQMAEAEKAAMASKTLVMTNPGPAGAVAKGLRPGDIISGIYGPSGLQADKDRKGVLLDVGHGSDGFWFRTAVPAIKEGMLPDTISTGMDEKSLLLPRATMTNVMTKFLAMGMTLDQVIERTTIRPAKAIHRPELGSIEVGGTADLAVLEMRSGTFGLLDSGHGKLTASKELRCVLTVRAGHVVWDSEGLSVTNWKDAGPYSNYK